MNITIKHRCGNATEWYAPDTGGYVRRVTADRPGTLGNQPTIKGVTLTCGPSEASLRRAVERYQRHISTGADAYLCRCGEPH